MELETVILRCPISVLEVENLKVSLKLSSVYKVGNSNLEVTNACHSS